MGTPSYMAPEQAQGQVRQIGPPADIYALGAILYEMLTGRPPFKAPEHDGDPPPGRLRGRGAAVAAPAAVARDLETICLKCLQKEPQKRYATAQELADDLRRYLDDRPIRARRTPLWERGTKWVRRHPATATLTGLGVAAVMALVAAGLHHDAQRKTDAASRPSGSPASAADAIRSSSRPRPTWRRRNGRRPS